MEKEKSIEELERESDEIRLEIDKYMKEMKRVDILFIVFLLVVVILSVGAIINSTRVDNELLETYDSCVDVNGERYCRVDE